MMLELCTPIIYGSPKVAAYHRKALDLQTPYTIINNAEDAKDDHLNLLATFEDEVKDAEEPETVSADDEAAQGPEAQEEEEDGGDVIVEGDDA